MKKLFLIFVLCGLFNLMAHSQALSNDTLHWAKYRKLTWNDFKGESIDLQGGMQGQSLMIVLANYRKANLFFPTKAFVVTVLDRKNSWINSSKKTDESLRYYRVMFDLSEVYARRLRKEFNGTKFGLSPDKVFQEKYSAMLAALTDRNKQYLKETKMGSDADMVNKWDAIIQSELKELEEYK